jgi:hypothetical protein
VISLPEAGDDSSYNEASSAHIDHYQEFEDKRLSLVVDESTSEVRQHIAQRR